MPNVITLTDKKITKTEKKKKQYRKYQANRYNVRYVLDVEY